VVLMYYCVLTANVDIFSREILKCGIVSVKCKLLWLDLLHTCWTTAKHTV